MRSLRCAAPLVRAAVARGPIPRCGWAASVASLTLFVGTVMLLAPEVQAQEFRFERTGPGALDYDVQRTDCYAHARSAVCAYELAWHPDANDNDQPDLLIRPRFADLAERFAQRSGQPTAEVVLFSDDRFGDAGFAAARRLPRYLDAADLTVDEGTVLRGAVVPTSKPRGTSAAKNLGLTVPTLADDLNTNPLALRFSGFTAFDGQLFFNGDDGITRQELWRLNGTAFELIEDKKPGRSSFGPSFFTVFDGALYFEGDTDPTGSELYRYTEAGGIELAADLRPGEDDGSPKDLAVLGDTLYFVANNADDEPALYRFTVAGGAEEVTDALPDGRQEPEDLFAIGDGLYYTAFDVDFNTELYRYTEAGGAVRIAETLDSFRTSTFTEFKGHLFFLGTTFSPFANALYLYDPVDGLEQIPTEVSPFNEPAPTLRDTLYFSGSTSDTGSELYRYTETGGVELAAEVQEGAADSRVSGVTVFNGEIVFQARGSGSDGELWRYTPGGSATLIDDLRDGPDGSLPGDFTEVGSLLYFKARDASGTDRLWQYDGTTASRVLITSPTDDGVAEDQGKGAATAVYDGAFYFSGNDGTTDTELYRYTDLGATELVADLNPVSGGSPGGSQPYGFRVVNDTLYFGATDGSFDTELYRYTPAGGGERAADVNLSGSSDPESLTGYEGALYFSARDDSFDRELYRYTPGGGAERVAEVNPTGSAFVSGLIVYNDTLYFNADDGVNNTQLFRYTVLGGAERVSDIAGPGVVSGPDKAVYDGALYFIANNDDVAGELYRYTSSVGVELVQGGLGVSGEFEVYDGALYFALSDPTRGRELYRYTTAGGVELVADINPDDFGNPEALTVFDGALYFTADDGAIGPELYRYTTAEGVALVSDLAPGGAGSTPEALTRFNGTLFFSASGPTVGREWFFLAAPPPGSIAGTLFDDANATGILDEGETGLEGVTVELYEDTNASGTLDVGEPKIDETTSAVAAEGIVAVVPGRYDFQGVPEGDYLVVVPTTPEGFVATTPDTLAVAVVSGQETGGQDLGFLAVAPVFDLALSAAPEVTGPGQGLLRAVVINRGSEPGARVRVKVSQQRNVSVSPGQILVGAMAPGERAEVIFTFANAQENAEVKLRVTDLDIQGDETDFENNTVTVFPMTATGDDAMLPVVVGTASGSTVSGRAEDRQPGDTGLASIELAPGATSLTLDVDAFDPGDGTVGFTARAIDPSLQATGTLVATDGEGNEGTLALDIPAGGAPLTLVTFATPDVVPVILGPAGGSFWFTAGITNPTDSPIEQDIWLAFIEPDGTETNVFGPVVARADAGQTADERFEATLSAEDPAG
ncbi:MAG: SdrD B-like domain-containing protein, partial [Bacteroidota bacterium]